MILTACAGAAPPAPPPTPPEAPRRTVAIGERFVCTLDEGVVRCTGEVPVEDPAPRGERRTREADAWTVIERLSGAVTISASQREICGVTTDGIARCVPSRRMDRPAATFVADGSLLVDRAGAVWRAIEGRLDGTPHLLGSAMVASLSYGTATCALGRDGRTRCLSGGYPGDGERLANVEDGILISTSDPLCVVRRDGSLHCAPYAPLIDGAHDDPTDLVEVRGVSDVIDVGAADRRICARTRAGSLSCATYVCDGGSSATWRCPLELGAPVLEGVTDFAVGLGGTVARTDAGVTVLGQLVESMFRPVWRWPPAAVDGVADAVALAMGAHVACASSADGRTRCWGGAIGATPRVVELDVAPVELVVTDERACGRDAAGAIGCAALGDEEPLRAPPISHVPVVALVGPRCLRLAGGVVRCGAGEAVFRGIEAVAFAAPYLCAVRRGEVGCFDFVHGSADVDPFEREGPRFGASLGRVERLAGGPRTLCGRRHDGTWVCSGSNDVGRLGHPTSERHSLLEAIEYPGGVWDELTISQHRICARRGAEPIVCTGTRPDGSPRDEGDTRDGSSVVLEELRSVRSLALGAEDGCALLESGSVVCWGAVPSAGRTAITLNPR